MVKTVLKWTAIAAIYVFAAVGVGATVSDYLPSRDKYLTSTTVAVGPTKCGVIITPDSEQKYIVVWCVPQE